MVSLYSAKVKDLAKLVTEETPIKPKRKYTKKQKPIHEEKIEPEISKENNLEKVEDVIEVPEESKKKVFKKARVQKEPEEPPKWFQKFYESIARESNEINRDKRPVKEIKEESKKQAEENWQKPQVREKVKNEVDNHMDSMYSMIFGGRRI